VDFACAECATDADCPVAAPICDPEERECVLCVSDVDCGEPTPYCEDGEACVECLEDEHCTDDLVCEDGECIQEN
jgi:hypothetical protein